MSEDVSAFQALPGVTPESSAFIDLYFDTSVRLYFTTHVNLLVNGWRVRLPYEGAIRVAVAPGAVSVVLDITLLFISKPRLDFIVQPGQVVPVFYRASHIKGDPGSLTFTKLEGRSPLREPADTSGNDLLRGSCCFNFGSYVICLAVHMVNI